MNQYPKGATRSCESINGTASRAAARPAPDLQTERPKALQIRNEALARAGNRCEGSPKYPNCRARGGIAHPVTDRPTTLHVISLEPGNDSPGNKRVMCMRCVLGYDFPAHATHEWRSRRKAMLNSELFPIEEPK